MCSCRTMLSLESQGDGGIAHTTGVLPWLSVGSLGWEGEEEEMPFICGGNMWSSGLGWMMAC